MNLVFKLIDGSSNNKNSTGIEYVEYENVEAYVFLKRIINDCNHFSYESVMVARYGSMFAM